MMEYILFFENCISSYLITPIKVWHLIDMTDTLSQNTELHTMYLAAIFFDNFVV